tara:strand:+ start:184 stop:309 length:126 start_codon:yes stop_codon:yes gene_type:complete
VEGFLNNFIAFILTVFAGLFAYYSSLEVEAMRREKNKKDEK